MDANTTQIIVAVVGAVGSASVLGVLAQGFVKFFNGTAGREKIRNTGLKEQRDLAWKREGESDARADLEAFNARIVAEYASGLRRDCTELHFYADGRRVAPEDLRKWPEQKKPPPEKETP